MLQRFVIVVRAQKAEALCQKLIAADFVEDLSVTPVQGSAHNGDEDDRAMLPRARIEGSIDDADSDKLIEIVSVTCRSSRAGDGKIFLVPVANFVE